MVGIGRTEGGHGEGVGTAADAAASPAVELGSRRSGRAEVCDSRKPPWRLKKQGLVLGGQGGVIHFVFCDSQNKQKYQGVYCIYIYIYALFQLGTR